MDARAPLGGGLGARASAEGEPPRHPTLRAEHTGAPQTVGAGTKPRGAPRTHHRWGGGESKEARATTRNTGTGGQGAARSAVDPDVPYT